MQAQILEESPNLVLARYRSLALGRVLSVDPGMDIQLENPHLVRVPHKRSGALRCGAEATSTSSTPIRLASSPSSALSSETCSLPP